MADGNDIDLRADLWLHTREKLEADEGVNLNRVSDLIDHSTMEWNHNRIRQHLQPQIAFKWQVMMKYVVPTLPMGNIQLDPVTSRSGNLMTLLVDPNQTSTSTGLPKRI